MPPIHCNWRALGVYPTAEFSEAQLLQAAKEPATAAGCQGAYLKGGQPIEVKVDTFPFQRYGTLKASLVWTSPDAEDKNAASRDTDTRAGSGSRAPE